MSDNPLYTSIIELGTEIIDIAHNLNQSDAPSLEHAAELLIQSQALIEMADEFRFAVREFAGIRIACSLRPITETLEVLAIEADSSDHMTPRLFKP